MGTTLLIKECCPSAFMSSLSAAVARAPRVVVEAAVAVVNNHILLPDETQ